MGQFLSSIQLDLVQKAPANNSMIGQPMQKVYEWHSLYKSVCQTFSIKKEQFEQIFGSSQLFQQWDREETGKVDALELFSGLAVFCQGNAFKEKLRFLFSLFDFNEVRSISHIDFEYMVVCICNSTLRIMGRNAKVRNGEIAEFVKRHLEIDQKRVIITQLHKKCTRSSLVRSFFDMIKKPIEDNIKSQLLNETNRRYAGKKKQKAEDKLLESQQTGWYGKLCEKMTMTNRLEDKTAYTYSPRWVYGIDTQCSKKPYLHIHSQIVYLMGALAIVYNYHENRQRIYNKHRRLISSLTCSSSNLIATGDKGDHSELHIWNLQTLETLVVFVTPHLSSISQIIFFNDDKKLMTIGTGQHNTIQLYNIQTMTEQKGSCIPGDEIISLENIKYCAEWSAAQEQQLSRILVGCSTSSIFVIDTADNISHQVWKADDQPPIINCLCAVYINLNEPTWRSSTAARLGVLTGHGNGEIMLSTDKECFKPIIKMQTAIVSIIFVQFGFIVAHTAGFSIYDLELISGNDSSFNKFSLSNYTNLLLTSHQIRYLSINDQSQLLLLTSYSEVVLVSDMSLAIDQEQKMTEEFKCRRLTSIFKLSKKQQCALTMLERSQVEERILFCCLESDKVLGVSLLSHSIVDLWTLADSINVMDCRCSENGIVYFVLGCQSGKLYIRVDWEETPRCYDCSSAIINIRLAYDCSFLLVCTADSHIYVFSNFNNSFVSQTPRKIHFENEAPKTVNFSDDSKSFIVAMDSRNLYQFYLPELKHKNPLSDGQPLHMSQLELSYCLKLSKQNTVMLPGLVSSDQQLIFLAQPTGEIFCYQGRESLTLGNCHILHGHLNHVSRLLGTYKQDIVISGSGQDQIIIEWGIQVTTLQTDMLYREQDTIIREIKQKELRLAAQFQTRNRPQPESFILCHGVNKSFIEQSLNKDKKLQSKLPPNLSIKPKYIFGHESVNKRESILFLNSSDQIMYSSSRFVVEMNTSNQEQKLVQGPNVRVSCLAMSSKGMLAIGQCGQNASIILQPNIRLETTHQGILHMCFFQSLLFSFGISNQSYTINVHDCVSTLRIQQRLVSQRIDKFLISSLHHFVSIRQVRIWNDFCPSNTITLATCAQILQANQICLGNDDGDLQMLTATRLIMVKKKAHQKSIIAMKYNRSISDFMLVTAGLEEVIKVWDSYFCQIACISLHDEQMIGFIGEAGEWFLPQQPLVVMTLDCIDNQIVFSLSNGLMLKLDLVARTEKVQKTQSISSSFIIAEGIESQEQYSEVVQYDIKFKNLMDGYPFRTGSTSMQIHFSLHPSKPLMATTYGQGCLLLINYEERSTVARYFFDSSRVTALSFSPCSTILAVGFGSGDFRLFNLNTQINTKVSLHISQRFEMANAAIISIKFSSCCSYIAVSFMPVNKQQSNNQFYEERPRSVIIIFKNRESKTLGQSNYYKYYEIQENISQTFQTKQTESYLCATKLNFVDSQSARMLVIYYQSLNKQGESINNDTEAQYRVFNLETKTFVKQDKMHEIPWSNCSFPQSVNAYQFNYRQLEDGKPQNKVVMTEMTYIGNKIIYGDSNGDIHIAKKDSVLKNKGLDAKCDDMSLARTYLGLTSAITNLKISYDKKYLFVSAIKDSCILQLELTQECQVTYGSEKLNRLNIEDREVMEKSAFYSYFKNAVSARQMTSSILQDVEEMNQGSTELSIAYVIGRRSFNCRKNLYLDDNGHFIYNLGPNIIMEEINSVKDCRNQSFLKADPEPYSPCAQISCFTVDAKSGLMALATQQQKSHVCIWNIKLKICLSRTIIDCHLVQKIGFSTDRRIIGLTGIAQGYYPIVMLIDWQRQKVLYRASLIYSPVWLIKDMMFSVGATFFTCGLQHLAQWSYVTDRMTYQNYDLDGAKEKTFTALVERQSNMLTSCQAGYIYLWSRTDRNFITKLKVHKASINCMTVTGNGLVITGGTDGKVYGIQVKQSILNIMWKKSLWDEESTLFSAKWDIQSIILDQRDSIYVGTRSGDVYDFSNESKSQILHCFDHQKPISLCFDQSSNFLYTLSSTGYLQQWDVRKGFVRDYHFHRICYKLLRFSEYLILVLDRGLKVLSCRDGTFTFLQEFNIEYDCFVSDAKMSASQRLLAVATSDKDRYELNIYEIDSNSFRIAKNHTLTSEVEFIDFSVDERFLLIKDLSQDLGIIELKQYKRINTIFIEYDVQWMSDGIIINEKAMNIHSCYHRENTITRIVQLSDKHILVADQIGTLRLFDYPCQGDRVGQLHIRCYADHMNNVSCLEVSPDKKWVGSLSQMDKAIIIWRVQS